MKSYEYLFGQFLSFSHKKKKFNLINMYTTVDAHLSLSCLFKFIFYLFIFLYQIKKGVQYSFPGEQNVIGQFIKFVF